MADLKRSEACKRAWETETVAELKKLLRNAKQRLRSAKTPKSHARVLGEIAGLEMALRPSHREKKAVDPARRAAALRAWETMRAKKIRRDCAQSVYNLRPNCYPTIIKDERN